MVNLILKKKKHSKLKKMIGKKKNKKMHDFESELK